MYTHPIVDAINYKEAIYTKLNEIEKALQFYNDNKCGLLEGYSGMALFHAYHYTLANKEESLTNVYSLIDYCLNHLSGSKFTHTFARGFTGIAWALCHLTNQKFIEQDDADTFLEMDEAVANFAIQELTNNRYDYLHGGLGGALYLIERLPHGDAAKKLETIVDIVYRMAVKDQDGVRWKDSRTLPIAANNQHEVVYNLGLAHGIPSILSILGLAYKHGISTDKTSELVDLGVRWLLKQKNKSLDDIALYPTYVLLDGEPLSKSSRLGWCYGDFGIAITLWNLGVTFSNTFYKEEALQILRHTILYRNPENGFIEDGSLCHGSFGVSHIYRKIYKDSGQRWLLDEADRWLLVGLKMSGIDDQVAGFKYLVKDGYVNRYGLLEGIAGIGLALVSAVSDEHLKWDRCLLIS